MPGASRSFLCRGLLLGDLGVAMAAGRGRQAGAGAGAGAVRSGGGAQRRALQAWLGMAGHGWGMAGGPRGCGPSEAPGRCHTHTHTHLFSCDLGIVGSPWVGCNAAERRKTRRTGVHVCACAPCSARHEPGCGTASSSCVGCIQGSYRDRVRVQGAQCATWGGCSARNGGG